MRIGRPRGKPQETAIADESPFTLLTREQDRALRAKAWRHVHRINPAVARRVWRTARTRDLTKS